MSAEPQPPTAHVVLEIRHVFVPLGSAPPAAMSCAATPGLPAPSPATTPPDGRIGNRHFLQFPTASIERAKRRHRVLAVYFSALAQGMKRREAEVEGMIEHLRIFRTGCDARTIRRMVKRVEKAGGFDKAPMTCYLDRKSSPHHAARKPRNGTGKGPA